MRRYSIEPRKANMLKNMDIYCLWEIYSIKIGKSYSILIQKLD